MKIRIDTSCFFEKLAIVKQKEKERMKRKPFQSKQEILFSGENDGMGFLVIIWHINAMYDRMKSPCIDGLDFRRNRKKPVQVEIYSPTGVHQYSPVKSIFF